MPTPQTVSSTAAPPPLLWRPMLTPNHQLEGVHIQVQYGSPPDGRWIEVAVDGHGQIVTGRRVKANFGANSI